MAMSILFRAQAQAQGQALLGRTGKDRKPISGALKNIFEKIIKNPLNH